MSGAYPCLPDGFTPNDRWRLVTLHGGSHDGTRFSTTSLPAELRVTAEGTLYRRCGDHAVYLAPGVEAPVDEGVEQLELG